MTVNDRVALPLGVAERQAARTLASRLGRQRLVLVPAVVFLVGVVLVGIVSFAFHRAVASTDAARFEATTADTVSRITDRLSAHLALIDGVAALHTLAPPAFDAARLKTYLADLDLVRRYAGLRGIGYAPRTTAATAAAVADRATADYGRPIRVAPAIVDEGYPVALMETAGADWAGALGFDLFSEPIRRAAMERARDTGAPAASGLVDVAPADGGTSVPGFVVFRPLFGPGTPPAEEEARRRRLVGYVFAPFAADEFFGTVLDASLLRFVAVQVFDGAPGEGALLYRSGEAPQAPGHVALQPVEVAGRTWVLRLASLPAFDQGGSARLVLPVAGLGLLLAGAAAWLARQLIAARLAKEEEQRAELAAAQDKELLLQEMKHRMKNVLARVQAVARQTARTTHSTPEFLASFEARLSAMSATHDILTRKHWEGADLREVVVAEIQPVLGPIGKSIRVEGPPVRLDPRQVLALGLALHELATNAVKHGNVAAPSGGLDVRWRLEGGAGAEAVAIDWSEHGTPEPARPDHRGFGSRLIETTITRELSGTLERRMEPTGLVCRMVFPVPA